MKYLIVSLVLVCLVVVIGCQSSEDLELCQAENEKLTAQIAEMEAKKEKDLNSMGELLQILSDKAKEAEAEADKAKAELKKLKK